MLTPVRPFRPLAIFLVLVWYACGSDAPAAPPQECNGHEELCDRTFDQVALPATHNSMSNAADEWIVPNQQVGIEQQLEDGIRGFLLDSYKDEDEFFFCHVSCGLGQIPIAEVYDLFVTFLEENPNEVLAIIFEDTITPAENEALFMESGLIDYVYTPSGDGWPTLAEMIASQQRVVVTSERSGPPPAWNMPAFDTYFETPFSFDSIEAFSCDPNRGDDTNDLFLLNHWVQNPFSNVDIATEANAYDVLHTRAAECQTVRGHIPNMVAIDHHTVGDLFEVVDVLNGVRDPR